MNEPGGGAVDANLVFLSVDHVSGKTVPVVAVVDLDPLILEKIGRFAKFRANRDGALVVEVRIGDGGTVNFGFQKCSNHYGLVIIINSFSAQDLNRSKPA